MKFTLEIFNFIMIIILVAFVIYIMIKIHMKKSSTECYQTDNDTLGDATSISRPLLVDTNNGNLSIGDRDWNTILKAMADIDKLTGTTVPQLATKVSTNATAISGINQNLGNYINYNDKVHIKSALGTCKIANAGQGSGSGGSTAVTQNAIYMTNDGCIQDKAMRFYNVNQGDNAAPGVFMRTTPYDNDQSKTHVGLWNFEKSS